MARLGVQALLTVRCGLAAVLAGAFFVCALAEDDDETGGEGKSSDILEVMAWCRDVDDGVPWDQVLRLAKTECRQDAEDDAPLRIRCSPEGIAAVLDVTRTVLDMSAERVFGCANGMVFLLAVTLGYARHELSVPDGMRVQVLLWQAMQDNFMLDASVWPVKTFDVLKMFDELPAAFSFPAVEAPALDAVTFLIPRCPQDLAAAVVRRFPGARVVAGVAGEIEAPSSWTFFEDAWDKPMGMVLNRMLQGVDTPLVLVVIGAALPLDVAALERLADVLRRRRVVAAAGPVVSEDRVYSDFCYRLQLRHYHLGFSSVYERSLIFDEASAASIRGSWFHEEDAGDKEGPCKLCETLPPTFLARTEPLRALGFAPVLDTEWALLDLAIRARRAPLVELRRPGAGEPQADAPSRQPGLRHGGVHFALCPFVVSHEVEGLGGPHLYGRSDVPATGVAPSAPWFGDDAAALGPILGGSSSGGHLRPGRQARMFTELNNLRDLTGPEGVTRHFGCNLAVVNCPVPNWVYRGWAAPPCCKETMRHLLFYIDEVFREIGVRYIITDGVLLGSYKYGGMLDWDADVDLHIHNDDFHLLEEEVQHRARLDGHFLRKHANNQSWLLQANDHNYLLIELNKRREHWDPDRVWHLPVEGRLFPAMEDAHVNISTWYGVSFFRHRLRHVPEWEEEHRPMFCATPYHYNCVDETQVPSGKDCQADGVC